jgi:Tol biopolymer transport system component
MLAPQWSPDGQQIVFGIGGFSPFLDFAIGGKKPVDPVNCGAQVALINADGAGFHLITSGPNNNAFAAFSPDGKYLVYRTAGPEGEGLRITPRKATDGLDRSAPQRCAEGNGSSAVSRGRVAHRSFA